MVMVSGIQSAKRSSEILIAGSVTAEALQSDITEVLYITEYENFCISFSWFGGVDDSP